MKKLVSFLFLLIFIGFCKADWPDFPQGLPETSGPALPASKPEKARWRLGSFLFGRLCQIGGATAKSASICVDKKARFFDKEVVGVGGSLKAMLDPVHAEQALGIEKKPSEKKENPVSDFGLGEYNDFGVKDMFDYASPLVSDKGDRFVKAVKRLEYLVGKRHTIHGRAILSLVKKRYNIQQSAIDRLGSLLDEGKSFSGYIEKVQDFLGKHPYLQPYVPAMKGAVGLVSSMGDAVGKRLVKSYESHEQGRGLRGIGARLMGYGRENVAAADYTPRTQKTIDKTLGFFGRGAASYLRHKAL